MRVLVLGAGKMVQSILLGLKGIEDLSHWIIYSPSGTSAESLAKLVGAQSIRNLDEVPSLDFILVGCKPQQLRSLKETIRDRFNQHLFISLLAAVPEEEQRRILGIKKLIRCMPNLPVEFRKGVVLLSSDSSSEELVQFNSFFSKLGTSFIVTEKDLEELTLLTGSGPALFYEFTLRLSEGFQALEQTKREALARAVLIGSAMSVEKKTESLSELTDKVTSKAGVTIAVLEAWRNLKFSELIKKGIIKGMERAHEIKKQIQS